MRFAKTVSHRWGMVAGAILICFATPALANSIRVPLHGSKVVFLEQDASMALVANKKIAEIRMLGNNKQLLINGKQLGHTLVTVSTRPNSPPVRYRVHVEVPLSRLRDKLKTVFPKTSITIDTVGSAIVLSGQVADTVANARVQKMVEAYLRGQEIEPNILNFITVRGQQQVQLRVKVAEVSRSHLRRIGANYWLRGGEYTGGQLSPGVPLSNGTAPDLGQSGEGLQIGGSLTPVGASGASMPLLTPAFSSANAFGLFSAINIAGENFLSVALNILQSEGLAKVLSEPTLVAYSGQKASFLAGGEYPFQTGNQMTGFTVEFKKYGVELNFTPTVLQDETVHLKLGVTVSELVAIVGSTLPALSTRTSQTTIQLKNGQSFAIAGLFQDKMDNSNAKVPILGDIPVVGIFFRQSDASRKETEVVVLATVNLVQPLKPGEVPALPGEDEYSDPGSWPFFLLGIIDGAEERKVRRAPAGPVGFSR